MCVCDRTSRSVSVGSVTNDTVTATPRKPDEVRAKDPDKTAAVLGDSVLVKYVEGKNLVIYGVSSPGTIWYKYIGRQG